VPRLDARARRGSPRRERLGLALLSAAGSILFVNAGSTSFKLDVVAPDETSVRVGSLDAVDGSSLVAVAHRVVHGGSRFVEPVLIDESVVDEIRALETLAPLHNAPALAGIEGARAAFSDLPHVAVFDTAFHASMPVEAVTYAVPKQWREGWGVRRFGFHGISVEWSVERTGHLVGRPPGDLRIVVCHLGGGSSVTAVRHGRSVDTTMGFSPLEGIPMNTRSGSVDPGVLVYVLREHGLTPDELDSVLNHESGVVALAGGGAGLHEIEATAAGGDADARLAVDVYVHRLVGAIAAMAAAAGGLDALVFTAGIGEKSAPIRGMTCERLRLLGIEIDPEANTGAAPDCEITAEGSKIRVLVVRAREELVAARAARTLLGL
jgi:acetate kinase